MGFTGEDFSRNEVFFGVPRWDWPRSNPFLAGLIAFIVTQAVNELSMLVHNDNGSSLDYAHLYNYLRHCRSKDPPGSDTKVLDKERTDMESFFKVVGDANIFKGERSKTLLHCYMRLLLAYGTSLSDLS
jgi:hypothetical protein